MNYAHSNKGEILHFCETSLGRDWTDKIHFEY